jgi:integrase
MRSVQRYRVREHLTETEMDKLLAALRRNRHGQRDWLICLLIYRHGQRVSEACDLRVAFFQQSLNHLVERRVRRLYKQAEDEVRAGFPKGS